MPAIKPGMPGYAELERAWDGRTGNLVIGGRHYTVLPGSEGPTFLYQDPMSMYSGSSWSSTPELPPQQYSGDGNEDAV
jgi:hypothetical protein